MKSKAFLCYRYLMAMTITLVMSICLFADFQVHAQEDIKVTIDGAGVAFPDQKPIILSGRTYVPVRAVIEGLGADVDWDPTTRTATIKQGDITLVLTIGSRDLKINNAGNERTDSMDVEPIILGGRTMLPIRVVAEELGYDVDWILATRTVTILTADICDQEIQANEPPTLVPTQTPNQVQPSSVNMTVSEFERRVFELTNLERTSRGLSALTWDDNLAAAARAHSDDLAENNMTGHTGSDGSSPEERARRQGVSVTYSGENVTYRCWTPEEAVESWMNSPGHRANILNSGHTHLGVGFAHLPGSQWSTYTTQKFGRTGSSGST
jgi:uncharacterized protein YkwD